MTKSQGGEGDKSQHHRHHALVSLQRRFQTGAIVGDLDDPVLIGPLPVTAAAITPNTRPSGTRTRQSASAASESARRETPPREASCAIPEV